MVKFVRPCFCANAAVPTPFLFLKRFDLSINRESQIVGFRPVSTDALTGLCQASNCFMVQRLPVRQLFELQRGFCQPPMESAPMFQTQP